MRAVLQRVNYAKVIIEKQTEREIAKGLVILLGVHNNDTKEQVEYLAKKILGLRIFSDENDKLNLSVSDILGQILVISNFTLYGETRKGNRPSFINSAKPDVAIPLYNYFVELLEQSGLKIKTGEFGADMEVILSNDGPVTITIDTDL